MHQIAIPLRQRIIFIFKLMLQKPDSQCHQFPYTGSSGDNEERKILFPEFIPGGKVMEWS